MFVKKLFLLYTCTPSEVVTLAVPGEGALVFLPKA